MRLLSYRRAKQYRCVPHWRARTGIASASPSDRDSTLVDGERIQRVLRGAGSSAMTLNPGEGCLNHSWHWITCNNRLCNPPWFSPLSRSRTPRLPACSHTRPSCSWVLCVLRVWLWCFFGSHLCSLACSTAQRAPEVSDRCLFSIDACWLGSLPSHVFSLHVLSVILGMHFGEAAQLLLHTA